MPEQPDPRLQKYQQFTDLLPLTLALAGLPVSEQGKYFNADQIDSRAMTVKHAYRTARRCVKELIES